MSVKISLDEKTPLVPQCKRCIRAGKDGFCNIYLFPEAKWRSGKCAGYMEPMKSKKEQNKDKGRFIRRKFRNPRGW